jgi:hypothetical protein
MPTKVKIKTKDNSELRKEIDDLYENMDQISLAKWSLLIAKHILKIVDIDYESIEEIVEGFRVNELWQVKEVRIHVVRQAGFKIHKIARECGSDVKQTALRVVGHAVASGHMREHAIIASDYAVKTIGLINCDSMEAITIEREWQLDEIKKFL